MKKVFKVGDKVRMIGYSSTGAKIDGWKGTIRKVNIKEKYLEIVTDNCGLCCVLPGQCRLLVKKPKQEVYITEGALDRVNDSGHNVSAVSSKRVVKTDVRFVRAKDQKRD